MKRGRSLFSCGELTDRERKNSAILDIIRRRGPIARADISKITGFNIVTVSNYIEHYLKQGLVTEEGYDVSSGGRKPMMVNIKPDAAYAIGISFNIDGIIGLLTDLKGNVVFGVTEAHGVQSGVALFDKLKSAISRFIEYGNENSKKIEGVGLAAAGVIGREDRTLRWPRPIGIKDQIISTSLLDNIENDFGIPVILENDANCAVFGEKWLTLDPKLKNIIYLYSGVACGIMINGDVYMGSSGCAGETGIFNEESLSDYDWKQESFGLGRWNMELGMLYDIEKMKNECRDSAIFQMASKDGGRISLATIMSAAERDELAVKLLKKAGTDLGKKMAFLVNLLNPEVVIVGGGLEKCPAVFMERVKATVRQWAFEEITKKLKIIPAQLGDKAASLGAASLVIKSYFEQM